MRKLMTGIAAAAMAASMGMTSLAGNVRNLLEQQVGQYTDRMVRHNRAYLSDENISRYLGGNSESTGGRQ